MRASILKLATKISIECGTYTGVTPNDPEYKILDPVITDEMAEIAMGLKVRKYVTAEQVAKKVKKPLGRVRAGGAVKPSAQEVASNPRARSAKLRVFEKR
mgnify:CR=1 FL=1